jgi:enamine deaminase RidA (YjgF/YER057c/UK114 family)
MPKRIVTSDRLMVPIAHFSHGARVGATIHLGVAAGVDRERRLAGVSIGAGDAPAQAEQLFANLRLALEALGGAWRDVVKVKTYIADWRDLPAYEAAHARALGALQAADLVVATWGFPLPQILLETELVACLADAECLGPAGVRAGGLHYCTARPDGEASDARAQVGAALRKLQAALDRAGLRPQDVALLNVSLADLRMLPAFEDAFRRVFRPPYPARSVVGIPLARAGQLVELKSVAACAGCQPVGGELSGTAASAAMLTDDWLFVSAQTAGGESGVEVQTRRAWERIAATVEAARMTVDDVVRTSNVLTDWRHYAEFNAGYGAFVTRPYPPRATVHAALAHPGALVQIEAIAHRQGRDAAVLEAASS